MAKPKPSVPMGRMNLIIPIELKAKVTAARATLQAQGTPVSESSFAEVALLELLARRDLADILKKRGATAKRS